MDQSTKILDLPSAKHLEAHHWTIEEKIFRRKARTLEEIETLIIPLKSGLLYKLKMSIFGPFMKEMNGKESQNRMFNENKLQILKWHLQRYNRHDIDIVEQRNGFLRNHYDLLKTAVDKCEIIDLGFFRNNLKYLQLDCCFIKAMDNSLQQFEQLQMLTLCGNFLKQVPGIMLPRTLIFLELFDNLIEDLSQLIRYLPKRLRHLGLGRNQLKDDCCAHLSGATEQLRCLKSIDMSDNDMHELDCTLKSLQNCTSLTALSLEGNPCSMLPSYKTCTLKLLPHLLILDGRKILENDRKISIEPKNINNCTPQLTFQCFRIMGLPEPPKDKKNTQTIHVEVNFPLLSECGSIEERAANQLLVPDEDATPPEEKTKTATKNPKKKDNKKAKKKSYFSGENEYEEQKELQNFWFKTEPVSWAKIMEFPATQVENLANKSMGIRDTFRSIVPVRIVYVKVAPHSAKTKKPKLKSKEKEKDNKATKGEIEEPTESGLATEESCKKTVLKKVTIASFYCELKSLNWSDETEDFYWADHPDLGEKAIRVEGSLKAIDYDLNASTKTRKLASGKTDAEGSLKEHLPNVLTCQIGFGVARI